MSFGVLNSPPLMPILQNHLLALFTKVIIKEYLNECKVKWFTFGITMVFFCWVSFVQMHMVINILLDPLIGLQSTLTTL